MAHQNLSTKQLKQLVNVLQSQPAAKELLKVAQAELAERPAENKKNQDFGFEFFINQVKKYGYKLVSKKQAKFFASKLRKLAKKHTNNEKFETLDLLEYTFFFEDREDYIIIRATWSGADAYQLKVYGSNKTVAKL